MFNLLQGFECGDEVITFPPSRVYSDPEEKPNTGALLSERAKLPTIVMEEGAPVDGGLAHFALMHALIGSKREIAFQLQIDPNTPSFPASILSTHRLKHALSDAWSWKHTCWQYGFGNIFETLYKEHFASTNFNHPKIFEVNNPPRISPKRVACMMPFSRTFDDVYSAIQSSCQGLGLECLRADEIYGTRSIMSDVVDLIDTAQFVVCDLSQRNPNVMYEAGISHTLGRETIIIAQSISEDVPFDLRHLRCIEYSAVNQAGREKLAADLVATISALSEE